MKLDELGIEDYKDYLGITTDKEGNLTLKLERTQQAMDYFWQIDEAFVRGRYSLCRELIAVLEDSSGGYVLKEYLPAQSATNNDRFSPADRYLEIYGKVN